MAVLNSKRQIALPKRLCDRLGVAPGDSLDIGEHNGRITILKRTKGRSEGVLKHLAARGEACPSDDDSRDRAMAISDGEIAPKRVHSSIRPAAGMGAAGLRTYLRIAKVWKLTSIEQRRLLGDPAAPTLAMWKRDPAKLSCDVLDRISHVLGIFKALGTLFPDKAQAHAWIRRANGAESFAGRSALERMMSGNVSDLYEVRSYLDGKLV